MLAEFYPTQEKLLVRFTEGVKWYDIDTILEPSAGKGNIAKFITEKCDSYHGKNSAIILMKILS